MDVRIFKCVKWRQILQRLSVDLMGKMHMWRCRIADMQRMTVCLLFYSTRSRASMHVYEPTEKPYWPDCMSALIATIAPTAPMHCFFSD